MAIETLKIIERLQEISTDIGVMKTDLKGEIKELKKEVAEVHQRLRVVEIKLESLEKMVVITDATLLQ
ncbi:MULTISPECIES: hypothetical protein [Lysinibacillus]|uniref:hypothetical protein n=1 Tax=Lysinibacillus TaxID=400634 RepID=UPI002FD41D56